MPGLLSVCTNTHTNTLQQTGTRAIEREGCEIESSRRAQHIDAMCREVTRHGNIFGREVQTSMIYNSLTHTHFLLGCGVAPAPGFGFLDSCQLYWMKCLLSLSLCLSHTHKHTHTQIQYT